MLSHPSAGRHEVALSQWVHDGKHPGSFLYAILSNDLLRAEQCADAESRREIGGIVSWLFIEAPLGCWGSPEACEKWRAKRGAA